jgi:hypothetical protein
LGNIWWWFLLIPHKNWSIFHNSFYFFLIAREIDCLLSHLIKYGKTKICQYLYKFDNEFI